MPALAERRPELIVGAVELELGDQRNRAGSAARDAAERSRSALLRANRGAADTIRAWATYPLIGAAYAARPVRGRGRRVVSSAGDDTGGPAAGHGAQFGVRSSTAPLARRARPAARAPAFGRAFEDPAHGFLWPVDLDAARARARRPRRRRSTGSASASTSSTSRRDDDPDLVYVFDPLLVDRGRRDPAPAGQAEPCRRARDPRGAG